MFLLQNFRLEDRPDKLGWLGDTSDVFLIFVACSIIYSSMFLVSGVETR